MSLSFDDQLRVRFMAGVIRDAVLGRSAVAEPEPLLLSAREAAAMLGVTLKAFYTRVERGQVPGVVRTGRKVQVNRAKLAEEVARCRSRSGR